MARQKQYTRCSHVDTVVESLATSKLLVRVYVTVNRNSCKSGKISGMRKKREQEREMEGIKKLILTSLSTSFWSDDSKFHRFCCQHDYFRSVQHVRQVNVTVSWPESWESWKQILFLWARRRERKLILKRLSTLRRKWLVHVQLICWEGEWETTVSFDAVRANEVRSSLRHPYNWMTSRYRSMRVKETRRRIKRDCKVRVQLGVQVDNAYA